MDNKREPLKLSEIQMTDKAKRILDLINLFYLGQGFKVKAVLLEQMSTGFVGIQTVGIENIDEAKEFADKITRALDLANLIED